MPSADGPAGDASPGESRDDDYSYGPGTVPWEPPDGRAAGSASGGGVSGGGAYRGPNGDQADYGQRGPATGFAGSGYEPDSWFTPRARHARGYPDQGLAGDGYAGERYGGERYGGEPERYPGEGYGGQPNQYPGDGYQPGGRPPAGYPGGRYQADGYPAGDRYTGAHEDNGYQRDGFTPNGGAGLQPGNYPSANFPGQQPGGFGGQPPPGTQPPLGVPPPGQGYPGQPGMSAAQPPFRNGYPGHQAPASPPLWQPDLQPPSAPFAQQGGFPPQQTFASPPPAGLASPPGFTPQPPHSGFAPPPAGFAPPPGFTPRPPQYDGLPGAQPDRFPPPQPAGFPAAPQPGAFQASPQQGAFRPAPPPDIFPSAAQQGFITGQQSGKPAGKTRLLIGGAAAVAVLAVGAVIVVPKLLGPSDPGCKAYTGTALTAYNQTIRDLNAQASQAKLTADMTTAIAGLMTAATQAQSTSAKSALSGLVAELMTVRADVQKGSVSAATVSALNKAANTADHVC